MLECGGRGALENGVPSREGQIMDGTTIELTEKLERLLREAAQVSVDLDRSAADLPALVLGSGSRITPDRGLCPACRDGPNDLG